MPNANIQDLKGMVFDRLTVISFAGNNNRGRTQWLCLCSCGKEKIVRSISLKNGDTKSCGCLNDEKRRSRNIANNNGKKHGMHLSKTYSSWKAMKARCTNKNHSSYCHYGDRGIGICDRWAESFENFYKDMGDRPEGKSLERVDNAIGYSKENCMWATPVEQMNNTRRNIRVIFNGIEKTLTQAAREFGLNPATVFQRVRSGVPIEDALSMPLQDRHKNFTKNKDNT